MGSLIAGGSAVLLLGGLLLIVLGARRRPVAERPAGRSVGDAWAHWTRRPHGAAGRRRDRLLLIGLAVGVVCYLVTGWVALLLLAPVVIAGLPYLLGNPPQDEVEMLGSLDRWVRNLAAVLPTGLSIGDALRSSVRNAPPLLADEIREVVARLDHRWSIRDALLAMANRLNNPDADSVLASLGLAAHRGGIGATATLEALSESIQDRLRALRDIEAERAKPRVVVRQVTVISVVVLTLALLVGGEFFAPYREGMGQMILLSLVAAYIGGLVLMRRMTSPATRERILQGRIEVRS